MIAGETLKAEGKKALHVKQSAAPPESIIYSNNRIWVIEWLYSRAGSFQVL